jgi:hypothetical protein
MLGAQAPDVVVLVLPALSQGDDVVGHCGRHDEPERHAITT